MYIYEKGMLVISLPTTEPAALHELLLKGLTSSFRYNTDSQMKRNIDGQHALIDLIEALLPDEKALAKSQL